MIIKHDFDLEAFKTDAARYVDEGLMFRDIPGLSPDNPWSSESLRLVEDALLSSDVDEHTEICVIKFIGEGVCRRFAGEWITLDSSILGLETQERGLGVERNDGSVDVANSIIPNMFRIRTGNYLVSILS